MEVNGVVDGDDSSSRRCHSSRR